MSRENMHTAEDHRRAWYELMCIDMSTKTKKELKRLPSPPKVCRKDKLGRVACSAYWASMANDVSLFTAYATDESVERAWAAAAKAVLEAAEKRSTK